MSFVSIEFLSFFPLVMALFFCVPSRFRWILLLAASLVFYTYVIPKHLLLLLGVTLVTYVLGMIKFEDKAASAEAGTSKGFRLRVDPKWQSVVIAGGVFIALVPLLFYKYSHFLTANVARVFAFFGNPDVTVLPVRGLPLGISFFTLQAIAYVIDVHRGAAEPQSNLFKYSLFTSFFPSLSSGPIARYNHTMKQLIAPSKPNYEQFTDGLRIFAWGFFKKVVIADHLGSIVDPIYSNPGSHSAEVLLIATLAYAFQLYGDFSGYSDMAIGIGKTFGISLMKNFDRPYFSKSLSEFWTRWHISLSSFLRDYVYSPIAMSVRDWGMVGVVFALLATFFVSGLWHGASWAFVAWGLMHGAWLSVEAVTAQRRKKMAKQMPSWLVNTVGVTLTFSFVSFSYIFFRAHSLKDALSISHKILTAMVTTHLHFTKDIFAAVNQTELMKGAFAALGLIAIEALSHAKIDLSTFKRQPAVLRWACYYAFIFAILIFGEFGRSRFIYFQF